MADISSAPQVVIRHDIGLAIENIIGKVVDIRVSGYDTTLITADHAYKTDSIKRDGNLYFRVLTNEGWLEFKINS